MTETKHHFAVADRVRLTCPHRTPFATVPAGQLGTVIDVDPEGNADCNESIGDLVIQLDGAFPDLWHSRSMICVSASRATTCLILAG
jgi:hypothetical protein